MATTESDYYDLLGVSRGASDAEIKRAFRTLARELHPDVSGEPDAAARFRDIAEAYEVLSDPERRATYDRFGKAGLRRGGFETAFTDFGSVSDIFAAFFGEDLLGGGARQRPQRGGDVQAVVEIDLEEAFTGASVTVPLDVAIPCARCDAAGRRAGDVVAELPDVRREPGSYGASRRACSASSSSSERVPSARAPARCSSSPVPTVAATGASCRRGQLDVDVPRGIHDGQQIRVTGQGHAGFRSTDRGHAFVVVRVRPDPRFVRDGDDLHTALRLTMTEAALGTTATVTSLSGEVALDVPAGTQPGEVRVLRGEGMPALRGSRRGSLFVRLDVAVPTALDEEQRALVEQLDEKLDDEAYRPRDEDGGFFGRLKSALR